MNQQSLEAIKRAGVSPEQFAEAVDQFAIAGPVEVETWPGGVLAVRREVPAATLQSRAQAWIDAHGFDKNGVAAFILDGTIP